jgi:ClpP class serine protease
VDKEIAKWYSENVDDIYSEVSQDKNAEWRAYLKGDTKPLQTIVTQNAKLFQQEVTKYRPLNYDKETTLRGGMFFAQDAKKRGLIDGVGTLGYAMSRLEANIKRRNNS